MILLTVGTQLPFDRLVRAVDDWCGASRRDDVFGQIGTPGSHRYRPRHFEWRPFVPPNEYQRLMASAELIIAHAGIGSIISSLTLGKPLVIMPRRASLGEHRNDHQLGTAMRFAGRESIYVANDETELEQAVVRALHDQRSIEPKKLTASADPGLVASIRRAILLGHGEAPSATEFSPTDDWSAQDG